MFSNCRISFLCLLFFHVGALTYIPYKGFKFRYRTSYRNVNQKFWRHFMHYFSQSHANCSLKALTKQKNNVFTSERSYKYTSLVNSGMSWLRHLWKYVRSSIGELHFILHWLKQNWRINRLMPMALTKILSDTNSFMFTFM